MLKIFFVISLRKLEKRIVSLPDKKRDKIFH